jgi:sulfate transport system substrate-binding protein
VLVSGLAMAACGGKNEDAGGSGGGGGGKLALVAYSTPQEAYEQIIPAFRKTGGDVSFSQSYGPSGDQARAVEAGLKADVVHLSLAPDMKKLVEAGIVAPDWAKDEYKGFATKSVVVFVVRKGNPKNIKTWDDLIKPGIEVIEANPFASGGARWNVMAAYGAQLSQGKSEKEAEDYLLALFKNVPVQDKSARDALQTFTGGKGDVLLSYENEAIAAQQAKQEVDYVIPDQTISIENPIAVTKKSNGQAKAFVDFIRSTEGQKIFAEKGYRPVVDGVKEFPAPKDLFTIEKFGGWDTVMKKFFDPDKSIVADIEKSIGVSTAK